MKRQLISRYALLAAIAAGLAAVVVAGLFVRREWELSRGQRSVPPPVAKSIEQQSLEFTFSKTNGQQTIFTVHAARATEYTSRQRRLLEDVEIVVHGNRGERNDHIRTQACDYQPASGNILCQGEVQLDLESTAGMSGNVPGAATGIHIRTRRLRFNRGTGEASTDAPAEFRFPQGQGSAVGVAYFSRKPELKLDRDVRLTLAGTRPGEPETKVSAAGLEYDREAGQLDLAGPVHIRKGERTLEAARMAVALGRELTPQRALAEGPTRMSLASQSRPASAEAGIVEILFDGRGRAERLNASGNVLARGLASGVMTLAAKRVSVVLDPAEGLAQHAWASGDVELESRSGGRDARIETQELEMSLGPATEARSRTRRRNGTVELQSATSPGAASVQWQSQSETLRLHAGELQATFGAGNQMEGLAGERGIRVERRIAGALPMTTSASRLHVEFSGGDWTQAEEAGNVRARQGAREAAAEKGRWNRGANTLELSGGARVSDPTMQTLATNIVWNQKAGDLQASGQVRSSDLADARGESGSGPSAGPANVVADSLEAKTPAGDAVYSGHARLWQGDLMVQADRITVHRAAGKLVAEGHMVGAFPQAGRAAPATGPGGRTMNSGSAAARADSGRTTLWRVHADQLTYQSDSGTAESAASGSVTLEGSAEAESSEGQLRAQTIHLRLERDSRGHAQLVRAEGEGGVMVGQGDRWGQAARGDYNAADGKFVLWGGKATLRDTGGDVVSGSRLTFYVADDTILVESSEGTRTLTLHPVPK